MADFEAVETHENLNESQCNPIREELIAVSSGNEENWRTSVNPRTQKSANPEKTIYEIEGLARGFESQSDLAYQGKKPSFEESYSCEICSWKFCTFDDLELHSLLHTVEISSNCQQFDQQSLGSEDDSRKCLSFSPIFKARHSHSIAFPQSQEVLVPHTKLPPANNS
ncbi:unnamed protein product [Cyprideis torosa]|uniref:Uncharacterized protein n=1 Tax=Cyprideis torosa TaxID=163714 RepID=A0A7R8ZMM3_9CRUS|nr:unnamed protein product [Cyprideis torosa]CAG0895825.1 unnamed protein product [Cyprideis torosa]